MFELREEKHPYIQIIAVLPISVTTNFYFSMKFLNGLNLGGGWCFFIDVQNYAGGWLDFHFMVHALSEVLVA